MKILLVDDDPDLLAVTSFALQQAGMLVVQANSFGTALKVFREERPDLAILDINLPGGSGFELCQAMRRESSLPILMLTVRNEESDLVRALELRADDYLTKPYSPRTLIARVKALLRRSGIETVPKSEAGPYRLDHAALELHVGAQLHRVTPLESRLLQLLIANAGQPVATDRLLTHIWGQRGGGDRQLLKQLVHRLRQKLSDPAGADTRGEHGIETVTNVGYRLRI
jgi:DNA-binding response OmpR family regulator